MSFGFRKRDVVLATLLIFLVGLLRTADVLRWTHFPNRDDFSVPVMQIHAPSVNSTLALLTSLPRALATTCERPSTVVNVALIAHGWKATGYHDANSIKGPTVSLSVVLRSLLRSTRSALHVIFVVGESDEAQARNLSTELSPSRWWCPLQYSFVRLNETQVDDWMATIGHTASHRTGHAGNVKFFYPLLFSKIDRLLMLDTDVMVARDISLLWDFFGTRFTDRQLFAFAPQWPTYHAAKDNQFNAGVGLLFLERMRKADWLSLSRSAIQRWTQDKMHPPCCAHGDQSVFHMIRYSQPWTMPSDRLLPRWWNVNKCFNYHGIRDVNLQLKMVMEPDRFPVQTVGRPFVGIVHFGCCKKCTIEKIGPGWSPFFRLLQNFTLSHS